MDRTSYSLPLLTGLLVLVVASSVGRAQEGVAAAGTGAATVAGSDSPALSHLLPHVQAEPPAGLLRPLGDESLAAILRGYDRESERRVAEALLAAQLHCRLLRVAVASDGSLTAALVKLQAGDRQSGLFSLADMEEDAAGAIRAAFAALPELGHLDLWATVPWQREFKPVHRPVFSLSVARAQVADLLDTAGSPQALLGRCGRVRVESALLDYALDGKQELAARPTSSELDAGPALDRDWLAFSAQARSVAELSALPRAGTVRVVLSGPKTTPAACLTIDDGPHPLITPLILDILRREHVHATFFVVGELVEQYPELARMIVREGHELGNHTYSHLPLNGLNPRGVWAQLRGCEVAVERASGQKLRWFRPPGGDCTEETLRTTDALGYTTVLWTENTGDWSGIKAPEITANALRGLRAGSILLMHQDELESVKALPDVIAGARAAGLSLGTVSEVAGETSTLDLLPRDLLPLMRRAHSDW